MRRYFMILSILVLLGLISLVYFYPILGAITCIILLPVLILGWIDFFQKSNVVRRNFPVVGRLRYLMEDLRPKVHQYFVETDWNGRPFNRLQREVVYNRSKATLDTRPFGTQLDVYESGYEWISHSIGSQNPHDLNMHPRVRIGSSQCSQKYDASILNISAMSYGSLSKNAVMALNLGAKLGEFAQNTGEGGISQYHLKHQGDLIFQIGTGYFGARTKDGFFNEEEFKKRASLDTVKMIELKLSQGAKPGHGGILPAKKNNYEIAEIRGVEPFTDVLSPPYHSAFSTPEELLYFIAKLRELSGGKPTGFKLCVGHTHEVFALAKAIKKTGVFPDFIAVDGGEGGTGAAPLEFSNYIGMPYKEAVALVYDVLKGFGLKEEIKIIAAGKITTGFDMFRAFALGADVCYSARAMMLALGCIQALECNNNHCPTGITTHKKHLMNGLVPESKGKDVARYHKETVHGFVEMLGAAGLRNHDQINRHMVYRRKNRYESVNYSELFPNVPSDCFIKDKNIPEKYIDAFEFARSDRFI